MLDLQVVSVDTLSDKYVLIKLTYDRPLPSMVPGQFVEVLIDNGAQTFLRRPISINNVDIEKNQLWLLVAMVGDGTRHLARLNTGDRLNCVLPLGNGFTFPDTVMQAAERRFLLVGGGVGVAPLLYFGKELHDMGCVPSFLLGARTAKDLLLVREFMRYGNVYLTTEDGSGGEKGFVTDHSILKSERFDQISTCGPLPMMKAVARYAAKVNTYCEASLENMMACGLGACLCCVEKTKMGNVCVCKEGPVFDVNKLLWL